MPRKISTTFQPAEMPPGLYEQLQERLQADDAAQRWAGRKWTAADCAEYCSLFFADYAGAQPARDAILPFLRAMRVTMPISPVGWLPERLRLESPEWWARELKKNAMRREEFSRISAGRVRLYCSDELLKEATEARARMACWMSRADLHDRQTGETLPLQAIAAGSVSNPAVMRTELMVRIRGMEEFATLSGHAGRFITVTAPSRYHRNKGTDWNKASPKEVQKYLCECWARVRAAYKRAGLTVYGVRITEPHTDACPHWHLLVWYGSTKQAREGVRILRGHFLATDGDEAGAVKNRVKTITMNPFKGGAAGYVAKYLCKNIDGQHLDDMTDRDSQRTTTGGDGAARVKAWAGAWRNRQFQFFGSEMPPIGLWRELRRIRTIDACPAAFVGLWAFADEGNWFGFILAYQAAPEVPRLMKHRFTDDLAALASHYGTPEAIPDAEIAALKTLNRYQEPMSRVIGVKMGACTHRTRSGIDWEIRVHPKGQTAATATDHVEAFAVVRYRQDGYADWAATVDYAAAVGLWSGGPEGPPPLDLWQ